MEKNANISIIEGYSEERNIKNVVFEGLKINSVEISPKGINKRHMQYPDFAKFHEGLYIEKLLYKTLNEGTK